MHTITRVTNPKCIQQVTHKRKYTSGFQSTVLDIHTDSKTSSTFLALQARCSRQFENKLLQKQSNFFCLWAVLKIEHIVCNKPQHQSLWKRVCDTQNLTLNVEEVLTLMLSRETNKSWGRPLRFTGSYDGVICDLHVWKGKGQNVTWKKFGREWERWSISNSKGKLGRFPHPTLDMCTLHSEYTASNNGSFYSTKANHIGSVKTQLRSSSSK